MDEFLIPLTAAIILVATTMAAMAIGVMFRRPCLKGSCGGTGGCPDCPNRPVK